MKSRESIRGLAAFTMIELLAIVLVAVIIMGVMLPRLARSRTQAARIKCVNNLKNVGLAFRIFATDHDDKFPMQLSVTNGGAMEYFQQPFPVARCLSILSNELSTPKILICPEDSSMVWTTNFASLQNSNISFFIGVNASEFQPTSLLAGDKGLTNNAVPKEGYLDLPPGSPVRWTHPAHYGKGNIAYSDGSVTQVSGLELRRLLTKTGDQTNRIALPIDR